MPTITCPGCGKRYNLPTSAAGQVAKCGCGRRFRVGTAENTVKLSTSSRSLETAPKPTDSASSTASLATSRTASSPTARNLESDEEFWDDALKSSAAAIQSKPSSDVPTGNPASLHRAGLVAGKPVAKPTAERKRIAKPKKGTKVYWGADWGKVGAGLVAFVVFGGLTVGLVMATGRISRGTMYLAIPALGGLFTALNGLMGEEGIW